MESTMNVALLMFIAARSAENRITDVIQEAGYSMTLAQGRVGARIGPDGTRLTELAAQAQVSKQTATHLVNQLEKIGFVERVVDPTDARARLVTLTDRAAPIIALARAEEAKIEAEWTRHLGARRMLQLRETLGKLREITDPYA